MEKITFYSEDGEEVLFEIIDSAIIDSNKYILVANEDEEAVILKEIMDTEENLTYAIVEDDVEFQKVALHLMENDDYELEIN
ncbi:MAG: hypothetical protein ATN33_01670 [Epulopiscium sp. Nele67-Bin001]|nr:MAG: hypothetical protein BEN18_02470 [Epulopiscium sp. Nuni2H_MBin001]OON91141.1 MAG: hypothetical protein ATN33_01670 [Epulopiscium sp. Nele67-Bin001]